MPLNRRATDPSFAEHLRGKGIAPSTIKVYNRVHRRLDLADPVGWLQAQVATQKPVQGTLDVWRGVVWHTLQHAGMSAEEASTAVPKLKGRPGKRRRALTTEQLELYRGHAQRQREPVRTILLLLPETGLRISEACGLRTEDVKREGNRYTILAHGDKPRTVPLNATALGVIRSWLPLRPKGSGWLFPSARGAAVTPRSVRKQTRAIAHRNPKLADLTPHMLRHTFCTNLLACGAKLPEVQALAGHTNIATTSRYLSADQLGQAVDRL